MSPRLLACAAFLAAASPAQAMQRETVCARQDTINGWSRPHRVEAVVVRGRELNQARQRLQFSPASLYVVLLWGGERVTAIELDVPVMRVTGQVGRDERGLRWEVLKGESCA
jgi:hypothetical protein